MVKTYSEKRFFEWHEDEISVTLRNKSGSYGGGSEVLVVAGFRPEESGGTRSLGYQEEVSPTIHRGGVRSNSDLGRGT